MLRRSEGFKLLVTDLKWANTFLIQSLVDGQVCWLATLRLATQWQVTPYLMTDLAQISRRKLSHILRTMKDMGKLLPFVVLIAAPGGSLLLPLAVKFFPALLPSVFQK